MKRLLSIFLLCFIASLFDYGIIFASPAPGVFTSVTSGGKGTFIRNKNVFLPPDERKTGEKEGPSIEEDQFLKHYVLYGTIKAGDYGVALIKINPKHKREVPEEIRNKKLIRLHPGERLEGYTLKAVKDESAVFSKGRKLITLETFDLDVKPERQTRVSVAQATPKARPVVSPPARPKAAQSRPKSRKAIKSTAKRPSKRTSTHHPPVKKDRPRSVKEHTFKRPPLNPQNNPFLRALKNASKAHTTKTPHTPVPFPFGRPR